MGTVARMNPSGVDWTKFRNTAVDREGAARARRQSRRIAVRPRVAPPADAGPKTAPFDWFGVTDDGDP